MNVKKSSTSSPRTLAFDAVHDFPSYSHKATNRLDLFMFRASPSYLVRLDHLLSLVVCCLHLMFVTHCLLGVMLICNIQSHKLTASTVHRLTTSCGVEPGVPHT